MKDSVLIALGWERMEESMRPVVMNFLSGASEKGYQYEIICNNLSYRLCRYDSKPNVHIYNVGLHWEDEPKTLYYGAIDSDSLSSLMILLKIHSQCYN